MKLTRIYKIGKEIGSMKLWSLKAKELDSPFFETMPSPLYRLIYDLEKISFSQNTINELNEIAKVFDETILEISEFKEKKNINTSKTEFNALVKKINKKIEDLQQLLIKKIPIWEDRILNALSEINIVRLSTNTILNPKKLSQGARSFFKLKIWNNMTDLEKADLKDACRCISLQAWTPSAMISMRALESALRSYYRTITSNDPSKKFWGVLINELNNNSTANKKLLGYFDYLKDIRNKLEHPEARFSQVEAENIFLHALDIFNTIYA